MKKFSIVLPIYGNEKNLPVTIPYIIDHLDLFSNYETEIIMVCDGSPDNSYEVMKEFQKKYPKLIRIAKFTKNNGQRAAVNCGMAMARGDVIGVISADLQDPFELFTEMLAYWEQGEKLVLAKREDRAEKGIAAMCSKFMHKLIHKYVSSNYPDGGFDFFVVDRSIAQAFIQSDTINNSMQLLLLELAGKGKWIGYTRKKREIGKSGWSLIKKLNQVVNIITIYSIAPFYLLAGIGGVSIVVSLICFIFKIVDIIRFGFEHGYAGLYSALFIVSGILCEAIALFGIYMFKWMQNMRKVPRYIIEEKIDEMELDNK